MVQVLCIVQMRVVRGVGRVCEMCLAQDGVGGERNRGSVGYVLGEGVLLCV